MEYIPVLYLSKTSAKKELNPVHLRDALKKENISDLYIIDEQGIRKNKPDYTFYQRFASMFDLWVDTGPRDIGDVVDDIFSGAKRIIIRPHIWHEDSIEKIKEISDQQVFIAVDGNNIHRIYDPPTFLNQADGVVLFITSDHQRDFGKESRLNQLIKQKQVYIFDASDQEHYWTSKNIKGFLKDIETYM